MFYRIADGSERIAAARNHQVVFARNYLEWNRRYKKDYKAQGMSISGVSIPPPFNEESRDIHKYSKSLGIYTSPSYKTSIIEENDPKLPRLLERIRGSYLKDKKNAADNEHLSDKLMGLTDEMIKKLPHLDLIHFLKKIIPFDNKYSERIRYFYREHSSDFSVVWEPLPPAAKEINLVYYEKPKLNYDEHLKYVKPLYLSSTIPRMGHGSGMWTSTGFLFILFFLTVVLYTVLHFVVRYIFLSGMEALIANPSTMPENHVKLPPGRHFIFGRYSIAIKKQWEKSNPIEIDCKTLYSTKQIGDDFSSGGRPVVVYNLDYKMYDCEANRARLELLEGLAAADETTVAVFSEFHPLQYFTLEEAKQMAQNGKKVNNGEPETNGTTRRWERLLHRFNFKYLVKHPKRRKKTTPPDLSGDSAAFIESECGDSTYLIPVKERVRDVLAKAGTGDIDRSDLKDRIYDQAKPIYDSIWRACSKDEKLVLIQLAGEGLLNIKNRDVIRGLLNRELIRLSPLRLMNGTFKDYLNRVEDLDTILEWKKRQLQSSWSKIKRPFLFLVTAAILFLVITQPDVLKSWLVLIPAFSAGIPAVLRIFDQLTTGTDENVPA